MFNYTQLFSTPLGVSITVGIIVMIYLSLMSISWVLPPALLLSLFVGLIVYNTQRQCVPPQTTN